LDLAKAKGLFQSRQTVENEHLYGQGKISKMKGNINHTSNRRSSYLCPPNGEDKKPYVLPAITPPTIEVL